MVDQNFDIGWIVTIFLVLLIGTILLTAIADPISRFDEVHLNVNESLTFTVSSAELGHTDSTPSTLQSSIITTGTLMTNGTNNTIGTNNYIVSPNGSIVLKVGAGIGDAVGRGIGSTANVNLTYSFYDDTYVEDSVSRTFTGLIILFFTIGILMMGIAILRKKYPDFMKL